MTIQRFDGWEVRNFDYEFSPMADNQDVYIDVEYGEINSIEFNVYLDNTVRFTIPVSVIRTWLQEYEKWKEISNK